MRGRQRSVSGEQSRSPADRAGQWPARDEGTGRPGRRGTQLGRAGDRGRRAGNARQRSVGRRVAADRHRRTRLHTGAARVVSPAGEPGRASGGEGRHRAGCRFRPPARRDRRGARTRRVPHQRCEVVSRRGGGDRPSDRPGDRPPRRDPHDVFRPQGHTGRTAGGHTGLTAGGHTGRTAGGHTALRLRLRPTDTRTSPSTVWRGATTPSSPRRMPGSASYGPPPSRSGS